jgi:ATP-dependent DNA helicase DinG
MYEPLAANGPFAAKIDNFAPREVQQQLASEIAQCFADRTSLVAEAGTGIGKTFAYLVPAISSGQKCVVSTATKNLQEQLFQRDIPQVCEVLQQNPRVALLKGRANYLCLYRMRQADGRSLFSSKQSSHDYQTIVRWSNATKHGDMAELLSVSEESEVRGHVTSTADNCLAQDCPDYDDCFVLKARARAMQADVLVVNHHLLCADMALKDDGFGELLPEVDNIIIDEAHRLPETLSMFFGQSFSTRQVADLASDMTKEYMTDSKELTQLQDYAAELPKSVALCREYLEGYDSRGSWSDIQNNRPFNKQLATLGQQLHDMQKELSLVSDHSRGLVSIIERTSRLSQLIQLIMQPTDDGIVCWYEIFKSSFVLHQTPIQIQNLFQQQWQHQGGSWIFTSATLAIAEQVAHFQRLLGLDESRSMALSSPFDYQKQAIMYLPKSLPDPSQSDHAVQLMQTVLPILRANKGRAFCLFTSYRALHEAAEWLSVNSQFKLLVQGTMDKTALLEQFLKLKNTVLLATASFWEGVDVRGANLSCVVIDKLPFSVPSDPVLKARIEATNKAGGNAFMDIQLPRAVLALKQGAGRLIRDHLDTGILILGDNRLVRKSYGKQFISSLPDMKRTRDEQTVLDFIQSQQDNDA